MLPFSRHGLIRSPTVLTTKLTKFLTPLYNQTSSQNPSYKMNIQPNTKRPTCPNCSKPLSLCLCVRIRTPIIDNKIHITILQHKLETKHPLNSARIAKLGLENVDLTTVSDVFLDAQFVIRSIEAGFEPGLLGGECTPGVCENACESLDDVEFVEGKRSRKRCFDLASEHDEKVSDCSQLRIDPIKQARVDDKIMGSSDTLAEPVISLKVGKNGEIKSIHEPWKMRQDEGTTPGYDHVLASFKACRLLESGFVVQKFQNQEKEGGIDMQKVEEFRTKIPKGSVVLFPAQDSIPIEAIDFEVKNLIVLDGTWAKANRMYKENPWLKVLPCVKLDMEKMSLFSEVRRQPKPGCLSTIESIVYALKALGDEDDFAGLCNLLDVFESMVEDQRRFKDESVRKLSSA